MSGKIEELKEKDFSAKVKEGIALVEFGASWCHACKTLEPHLESLAKTWNDKVKFFRVDVTKNPGLASRLGVMSLPNILIFKNGKVIDQMIGLISRKSIEEEIKKIAK